MIAKCAATFGECGNICSVDVCVRMQKNMAETTMISFQVPKETARKLEALAEATNRSEATLGAEAIEEYISLQEWQIEAIKQGIKSADQGRLIDHSLIKK